MSRDTGPDASLKLGDNCLDRIQSSLDQLHGSVRQVAEHVLANPWETRGISIVELARRIGVSENTVSRFCLALGYPGYRAFSTELASTLGRLFGAAYAMPPEVAQSAAPEDGPFQIVTSIFALEVRALQDTLRQIDRGAVERAIELLNGARKVVIGGMGATAPAASTAAYRLTLLGIDAVWASDPYVLIAQVASLGPGDVVIGMAYLGQTRVVVDVLKTARANGAATIALTASPGSPLARSAEVRLVVAGAIPLFTSRHFSARVAGVLLVDAIVAAVAWTRYRGTPQSLLRTFDLQREFLERDGTRQPLDQ